MSDSPCRANASAVSRRVTHAYVDHGKLPGVQTLISRRGELVHHDCYGFTDVEAEHDGHARDASTGSTR